MAQGVKHGLISIEDVSTPIVILQSNHRGGLGIARSLGRCGINVYGVNADPRAASFCSRYFKERFTWDLDNIPPESNVQHLLKVGKRIGKRSILIPTTDEGTILLADYADILSESYIFPKMSPQLVRALTSKKQMYFTAKKYNVATPEACFPQSKDDVKAYVEYAAFPIMLKGISGRVTFRRSGKKMFIARTKEELFELYGRYEDRSNPNFMLQEYIPGGEDSVWMFNGYFDKRSECLFGITGRKIRQAPAYTGATSLGVCLKNDIIAKTTRHLMRSIGYEGILDIGYRYDKRDGKYKVLDINPRIGSTFRLFVGNNGLDVARVAYLDLTRQHVPSSKTMVGRKWLVEDADLASSIKYYRDKNLTLTKWASSLRNVQETAWFSVDDLFPFFAMCKMGLHDFFRTIRQLTSENS
jgi:D-aspartate ligase